MRQAIASVLTSFSLVVMTLLTGAGPAQANVPTSNCRNGQVGLVNAVICEIDINDDDVLDSRDLKIIIPNCVASGNELAALADDLDALVISNPPTDEDRANIQAVVDEILTCVDRPSAVILPCGCSH